MQSEQDITGLKVQMSAHKVKIDLQQCDISVLQEGWDGEGGRPAGEHGCRISLVEKRLVTVVVWFLNSPLPHHPTPLLPPPPRWAWFKFESDPSGEKQKKNTSLAINGS